MVVLICYNDRDGSYLHWECIEGLWCVVRTIGGVDYRSGDCGLCLGFGDIEMNQLCPACDGWGCEILPNDTYYVGRHEDY